MQQVNLFRAELTTFSALACEVPQKKKRLKRMEVRREKLSGLGSRTME